MELPKTKKENCENCIDNWSDNCPFDRYKIGIGCQKKTFRFYRRNVTPIIGCLEFRESA